MYYLMVRYYEPKHGVFLSLDPDPGDEDDIITQNGYTYANNNPVMLVDPDGHWVWLAVNAGFAAYDGYKAYKAGKGWKGAAWAAASNFGPGKVFKGAKKALGFAKKAGRSGKLAKQKSLIADTKLPKHIRGFMANQKRQLGKRNKRGGKRTHMKNPPGYDLAHWRGKEARKGNSYLYSSLQLRKDHRRQHSIEFRAKRRR